MEIGWWIITDMGVGCKDCGGIKTLALNRSYLIYVGRRIYPSSASMIRQFVSLRSKGHSFTGSLVGAVDDTGGRALNE